MEKIIFLLILILIISGCKVSEKELCEKAGGKWNECGSACRGEAEYCIAVCNPQCECNENHKCPKGFRCEITEKKEFGVCVKE